MPTRGQPLLSDLYSSVTQRQMALDGMAREDFLAALRLDVLLFERVVVPDAHLFDGRLFALDSPSEFVAACGHTSDYPTLQVRIRSQSFESSLLHWLYDKEAASLRPLEFRFLLDEQLEERIAEQILRGDRSNAVSPRAQLARIMAHCGVDESVVTKLQQHWDSWSSVQVPNFWSSWPDRPYNLKLAVKSDQLTRENFFTAYGWRLYRNVRDTVLRDGLLRSADVDQLLRGDTPPDPDGMAKADSDLVRAWYHDCRQLALATQHGAVLATTAVSHHEAVSRMALSSPGTHAVVPDAAETVVVQNLLSALALLSTADFTDLLRATRTPRRTWLITRDQAALNMLAETIVNQVGLRFVKPKTRWTQQERMFVPFGTAVAGYLTKNDPLVAMLSGAFAFGLQSTANSAVDFFGQNRATRLLIRWMKSYSSVDLGPSHVSA